jgi:hypothetical protein
MVLPVAQGVGAGVDEVGQLNQRVLAGLALKHTCPVAIRYQNPGSVHGISFTTDFNAAKPCAALRQLQPRSAASAVKVKVSKGPLTTLACALTRLQSKLGARPKN